MEEDMVEYVESWRGSMDDDTASNVASDVATRKMWEIMWHVDVCSMEGYMESKHGLYGIWGGIVSFKPVKLINAYRFLRKT